MDREESLKFIEERHSVRSYKKDNIESEKLDIIRSEMERLNDEYDLNMQLMENADGVFNNVLSIMWGWGYVPCYIAFVGPRNDELEEKCGYCGEVLAILIQSLGMNTCWAGVFKRKNVTAKVGDGEHLCLTMAFGYGVENGKCHKSKRMEDVYTGTDVPDWFIDGVKCALLAPTAVNQQKFMCTYDNGKATVTSTSNSTFAKVDLGIVKYHFEIGSGRKL